METEVFLLLMLVGVFAGFVDSAVGGGGLLRLPAMLSAGLPPHVALGTNKLASAAAAAIASAKYLQSEIVPRKAALIGWVLTIVFSVAGALVVLQVQGKKKATVTVPSDVLKDRKALEAAVMESKVAKRLLEGQKLKRTVVVLAQGKAKGGKARTHLVNFVFLHGRLI